MDAAYAATHTLQRASATSVSVVTITKNTARIITSRLRTYTDRHLTYLCSQAMPRVAHAHIHTVYLPLTMALINCPRDEYDGEGQLEATSAT